jgi:16S rRNA (guanine527-N7)-methyltransferase
MIDALERAIGRPVSRETFEKLEAYAELLRAASVSQNLIASSTLDTLWDRHIIDSAQLVRFEPKPGASWADIGSGAGLPGIVIALLVEGPVTLIEPRRLRAQFLEQAINDLKLTNRVRVYVTKVERVEGEFDVITARAVAPLSRLLDLAEQLSHSGTIWALPKGKNAKSELAEARRSWQCEARVEASCTDPDARILVLSKVRAKSKR